MAIVGKILTATFGPPTTSPSGRVKQEERTFKITGKVLGKGAFGTVMEGVDLRTRSPVAVKIQQEHPEAAAEAQALRLFRDIPHAVRFRADILGSPKTKPEEQKRHLVMDLLTNKDIVSTFFSTLTPDLRLTYDERITIARQGLESLEVLHSRGWTFFDFKLTNLIFDRNTQNLRLIDFGGAKDTTQKSFLSSTTTPSNRAPEYILKKPISPSYDIWSFGCALYSLLTDKILFYVPSDMKKEEMSHYVLQQIVAQLGKPSFKYLANSPTAPEIFDINVEFRKKTPLPPMKKWNEVVREEGQKNGWPSEEIDLWIDMLDSCFRYENRATAAELLKSPIFENDIGIHLHFDSHRSNQCNMYLLRAEFDDGSGNLPNDSCFDLKIDVHHSMDNHLHLSKDLNDEYLIILEKDGIWVRQKVLLKEGSILDISHLQKDLFPIKTPLNRKTLLQKFEEAALELPVPNIAPIKEERSPEVQAKVNIKFLLDQKTAKRPVESASETPSEAQPLRRSKRIRTPIKRFNHS